MTNYRLEATKGIWYDLIESGEKTFDFRKGYREIHIGDTVTFIETAIKYKSPPTGKTCTFTVDLVVHSKDFPRHFGWKGEPFTIIQFRPSEEKEQ